MRKSNKQNILAVAAIVLCFMLTLGLCYLVNGEGFLLAFVSADEHEKCYLLCSAAYEDITLARNAAELVKSRGGAGYVIAGDSYQVVLAAYESEGEANKVLQSGSAGSGAYLIEVTVGASSVKWADSSVRDSVSAALEYYKIVFDCLYSVANGIADSTLTVADAKTSLAVCSARVEELRADFNAATTAYTDSRYTEIKLALVTALALIDNAELDSGSNVAVVSSLRYQLVQLVKCREALAAALN